MRGAGFGGIVEDDREREETMIKGLHHNAYRCRDSEETRTFYEDFLGLELVSAFPIDEGRGLHTFFQMDDGSCLAFFEVPGKSFDFKRQDSLDLHIALGVEPAVFDAMLDKAKTQGREVRGPVDHGFVRSIYFRDPNGYVIELTASTGVHGEIMDPAVSKPYAALARWQAEKPRPAPAV
jgi:catechol 2,3-dioxygenase-like lactoylglutathione lyase family enzyme